MLQLDQRQLGKSGIVVPALGVGVWSWGDKNTWGYGKTYTRADVSQAYKVCLDAGLNFFDTAEIYGNGESERILGECRREDSRPIIIASKFAPLPNRFSASRLLNALDATLDRLRVSSIDLYQVHWPKPDEDIEEGWTVMADLQREGKVRWIGVSNFSVSQMERALKIAPITSNQPPYSMLNRTVEAEILPFTHKHNIGTINYAPMHSGLLTGAMTKERVASFPKDDFRRNAKNYQEPLLSRNLAVADFLKTIGTRHNVTAGVVAIAWTLHNPAITAAIVGGRNARQVEGVIPAINFRLTEAEYAEINAFLAAHP